MKTKNNNYYAKKGGEIITKDGKTMLRITKKSGGPYLATGALWLLWALTFPFYKLTHIIMAAVVGAVLFVILDRKIRAKEVIVEINLSTGVADADAIIEKIATMREKLSQCAELSARSGDKEVRGAAEGVSAAAERISKHLRQSPEDAARLRSFANYYIPTTEKLAAAYGKIQGGAVGENAARTRQSILNALNLIEKAFSAQLDRLYDDDALDISSDVAVLETMMKNENISSVSSDFCGDKNGGGTAGTDDNKSGGIRLEL
ncbi:MAG: 5-bromo-4-chloroindolyl phosphate hydrolysis family protein [Eubacteriales bacterium]|jgi:hypothetical protein|nr:hypothetical protein [Clostridiales bacterium]